MRILSTICFILITCSAFSQQWFPVDATWHWGERPVWWGGPYDVDRYFTQTVTRDTIIDSLRCVSFNGDNRFTICENDDRVYRLNRDTSITLLYNFNKGVGDSWEYATASLGDTTIDTFEVTIIDIQDYVTPYDDTLEQYTLEIDVIANVSGCANRFPRTETIFKYVGKLDIDQVFLYEGCGVIDGSPTYLRCYEDSILGHLRFTTLACDTIVIGLNQVHPVSVTISPNPVVDNSIHIQSNDGAVASVAILDRLGSKVYELDAINQQDFRLDVSYLSKGSYYIYVETTDHKTGVNTFVRR